MRTPINLGHKSRYAHSTAETGEMEQRELMLSLFGGVHVSDRAKVGRIETELATKIGAQTDLVMVSPVVVMKVKGKHTTVLYSDLELLQHSFTTGRVQQDGPRSLIFLFRDPRQPKRTLKVVVKAARRGEELLLATYHPCTGKRLAAAMKRGSVVRDDGTWEQK
jgi:hypothetical protein